MILVGVDYFTTTFPDIHGCNVHV